MNARRPAARSTPARIRYAHHEAGHAVISAALVDTPRLISIRRNRESAGRTVFMLSGSLTPLILTALGGYAAEHVLYGKPRSDLVGTIAAMTILTKPGSQPIPGMEGHDAYLVAKLLRVVLDHELAIEAEAQRLYELAVQAVTATWPAVQAVARTLLHDTEISRAEFEKVIAGRDIRRMVSEAIGALPGGPHVMVVPLREPPWLAISRFESSPVKSAFSGSR
jgi:hypothetical protein